MLLAHAHLATPKSIMILPNHSTPRRVVEGKPVLTLLLSLTGAWIDGASGVGRASIHDYGFPDERANGGEADYVV